MWHEYLNATSINEVLTNLNEKGEHARIVAGATDLILELERGVRKGIETCASVYWPKGNWMVLSPVAFL